MSIRRCRTTHGHDYIAAVYIYTYSKINGGRTTETRHADKQGVTPAKRGSSLPNFTLIRISQGSLDRRRREKVIWEMFTENYCNTFADTWKVRADLRKVKVVIDEVAQYVSWEREGGTKRLVRLPMGRQDGALQQRHQTLSCGLEGLGHRHGHMGACKKH